jgi:hypothetical protein
MLVGRGAFRNRLVRSTFGGSALLTRLFVLALSAADLLAVL